MAARILKRRELRRQSDAAESTLLQVVADDIDAAEEHEDVAPEDDAPPAKVKAKAKAPSKPRKPRKLKAVPRMRARWGVYDGSNKQFALFDYKDRAGADAKVAEMAGRKNGPFFLQLVKEPMPEETSAPAVGHE